MVTLKGKDEESKEIRIWVPNIHEVESQALDQLKNISTLPILAGPLAVMPDVHLGKGATVGSVVPTTKALIPAAVGVDIGCGMAAIRTNLMASDLPEDLKLVRNRLEAVIPVGFNMHDGEFRFQNHQLDVQRQKLASRMRDLSINPDTNKVGRQLGTLGGGNHFLEICLDTDQRVWVMLHSGSRNIGKTLAEHHIGEARKGLEGKGFNLPDKDLAWLAEDINTAAYNAYVHDLGWAQEYARLNREAMLESIWLEMTKIFVDYGKVLERDGEIVNCHHNYVEFNYEPGIHVTRKGAVSAREGEMGIIPGSMGAKSFIVKGKGNPESYCSCSHGAGRKYSRSKAKQHFTLEDLVQQTEGVECRKDGGVLDEIPGAYKDIQQVIDAQTDLIEVVYTLKQILCIKG